MSVLLVQRPHNVPGLISMNRQQSTPKRASQRQNNRSTHNHPGHHITSPPITTPAPVPVLSPKLNRKQQHSTSRPANQSNPQSVSISTPASEVPRRPKHAKAASQQEHDGSASRRRSAKCARQSAPVAQGEHESGLPEWDSPATVVSTPQSKPRMNRTPSGAISLGTPTQKSPHTNWQQAALFGAPTRTQHNRTATLNLSGLPLGGGPKTAPIQGSFSAPSSPERHPDSPNGQPQPVITRSPTVPNFPTTSVLASVRPGHHIRTPSFPNFPTHRYDSLSGTNNGDSDLLEALFRSATLSSSAAPSSLTGSAPSDSNIHARVAKARKGKKGASLVNNNNNITNKDDVIFASASFQAAPDAMVFPKPGGSSPFATKPTAGMFGGPRLERLSFDLNDDEDSLDSEDSSSDAGEDSSQSYSNSPAFLM